MAGSVEDRLGALEERLARIERALSLEPEAGPAPPPPPARPPALPAPASLKAASEKAASQKAGPELAGRGRDRHPRRAARTRARARRQLVGQPRLLGDRARRCGGRARLAAMALARVRRLRRQRAPAARLDRPPGRLRLAAARPRPD